MCITSFGTCDLKEEDGGDMPPDRILLCFLKRDEGTDEVKPINQESRNLIAFCNSNPCGLVTT